jgi:error-prone DNA polymerase
MVSRADTVGVFQIESRAQMSMLPRLKPRCFYDLVIEVAIVRPGPIQGDMVHPYLRRRAGLEPVQYPDERIKAVLEKTLGVPIFQEQAMRLAVVAAGFTPGEADQLRRAMGAWRRRGVMEQFQQKLVTGMLANGYSAEFADRVFRQIQGFGEYGFPESHAASFALLVYVSAWLKLYHPAAFTCALLNSQPMGFYAPAQLVADAKKHGVQVLPIDVNRSEWDCTLEEVVSEEGVVSDQWSVASEETPSRLFRGAGGSPGFTGRAPPAPPPHHAPRPPPPPRVAPRPPPGFSPRPRPVAGPGCRDCGSRKAVHVVSGFPSANGAARGGGEEARPGRRFSVAGIESAGGPVAVVAARRTVTALR